MEKIRALIAEGRTEEALRELSRIVEEQYPGFRESIRIINNGYEKAKEANSEDLLNRFDLHTLLFVGLIEESNASSSIDEGQKSAKAFKKAQLRLLIEAKQKDLRNVDDSNSKEAKELETQLKDHIDELIIINDLELSQSRADLGHVDFVNRQFEKDRIETPTGKTEYWLIDAPAGYGKTELVKQLYGNLNLDETVGLHIHIDPKDGYSGIYERFLNHLELTDDHAIVNEQNLGHLLYQKTLEKHGRDLGGKGLTIFIDFDGKASKYFHLFRSKVIPTFWDSLRGLKQFVAKSERFKVVYAGRHLSRSLARKERRLRPVPLSDFNLEAITSTVETRSYTGDALAEIAAHILYTTGGHPLGIAKALHILDFFGLRHLREQDELVYDLINLIAENIEFEALSEDLFPASKEPDSKRAYSHKAPWFFAVLQACSVFRLITADVLRDLKGMFEGIEIEDAVPIEKRLRSSLLWLPMGFYNNTRTITIQGVLQDGIARRVLNISLRKTHPEKYKTFCGFAKERCFKKISEEKDLSSLWLIEYLFQSLQIHALDIGEAKRRQEIADDFYSPTGDFTKGIDAYTASLTEDEQRYPELVTDRLLDAIESDFEFQFIVKYFLRKDDAITEEPMDILAEKLKNKFLKNQ